MVQYNLCWIHIIVQWIDEIVDVYLLMPFAECISVGVFVGGYSATVLLFLLCLYHQGMWIIVI